MSLRGVIILGLSIIFFIQFASSCTITPYLINQDPYPAVPGETVKLLFQVKGVEDPGCGLISLEFLEDYPFSLDPGYSKFQTVTGGTFTRDYNSFWMVPYKVRVDSDALDGDQLLRLKTSINSNPSLSKIYDFNVTVEEVRTDFIVTIDSYSFSTNKLSLGIVNIGEKNARSITIEIPEQDNVSLEGGHVKILGELDSNEDTTATFDAVLNSGPIKINIAYNDEIGERREISKEVVFSELQFENTREKSSISFGSIILWLAVIGIIVYLYLLRRRKLRRHAAIHNAKP